MKIHFSKKIAATSAADIKEGRHIGPVVAIVGLGDQPSYEPGKPPVPSVGVVVQVAGHRLAKKMSLSDHPLSKLYGFLDAALENPEEYSGDDPLRATLGRPVAVEVRVNGKTQSPYIDAFCRPESFELLDAQQVNEGDLIYLEGAEELEGEAGKAIFLRLHPDIRSWLSKRVRSK